MKSTLSHFMIFLPQIPNKVYFRVSAIINSLFLRQL